MTDCVLLNWNQLFQLTLTHVLFPQSFPAHSIKCQSCFLFVVTPNMFSVIMRVVKVSHKMKHTIKLVWLSDERNYEWIGRKDRITSQISSISPEHTYFVEELGWVYPVFRSFLIWKRFSCPPKWENRNVLNQFGDGR